MTGTVSIEALVRTPEQAAAYQARFLPGAPPVAPVPVVDAPTQPTLRRKRR